MDGREDDSSEGESSDSWESECEVSNPDDSLFIPTPECPGMAQGKPSPIDLPNKLFYFPLPQLGKFFDSINEIRSCNTPGCRGGGGGLAPISVKSQGLGGGVSVSACCTGCGIKGAMFETHVNGPGNTNVVSKCVQVAFIVAGCTHMGYYKILKNALTLLVNQFLWIQFIACIP